MFFPAAEPPLFYVAGLSKMGPVLTRQETDMKQLIRFLARD
jgi:hypothetical protein